MSADQKPFLTANLNANFRNEERRDLPRPVPSPSAKHEDEQVSQVGQCYLRAAGYSLVPFHGDLVLPTLLANPTAIPVDDVRMTIVKLIYKDDKETESSLVEGQPQDLEIGT